MIEGKKIVTASDGKQAQTRAAPQPARNPWWIYPHLLSLDAPAVAIGWQAWWAHVSGVRLSAAHHLILGLCVWAIYLADRLADGLRASPAEWGTPRHEFYHRRRLLPAALLAGALVVLIGLTPRCLSGREFAGGAGLLTLATVYFWQIHGRARWPLLIPKEAAVGGLFAVGVGYFTVFEAGLSSLLAVRIALFGALCFLNCALITRWERTLRDRRDRGSLLNAFPELTEHLGTGAALLAIAAALVGVAAGQFWTFVPLLLGAVALAGLDFSRNHIPASALRVLADVALLTPWAFLWLI